MTSFLLGEKISIETATQLVLIVSATIVSIIIIIGVVGFLIRKIRSKKITEFGTDCSPFAQQLMDEYHENRNLNRKKGSNTDDLT